MRYIARKHDLCGKVNFLRHTSEQHKLKDLIDFFYNYTDGRRTRASRYAGGAEYGLPVRLLCSSAWWLQRIDRKAINTMLIGNPNLRNGWVRLCYAAAAGADYESSKKAYLEK